MADCIPPRKPRSHSTRERLQNIDHGVNNNLDTALNAIPEALGKLTKKFDDHCEMISQERRTAHEYRVKIDALYGQKGSDGMVGKIDDTVDRMDRKQNWMIGIATGGWIVAGLILHWLHSPAK